MFNEKSLRIALFILAAVLHAVVILFLAFDINTVVQQETFESARVMKLADLTEAPPPPPQAVEIPQVEAIAETMIETDIPPPQNVIAAGSVITDMSDYLPMHLVSQLPGFSEDELRRRIIYPPIAQRSELEGIVYLEIFVDMGGTVRNVTILREDPPDRGFGEAAVRAFMGFTGNPALANGVAVAVRYRYPVRFSLR